MAATMVTTTSRRITHVTTAMTVTSVGGSVGVSVGGVDGVGGATMQLSGFDEEITTGHVVSTCS